MEMETKSFGENLNEWFRSMGQTWQPLVVLCAIVYVPLGVITTGLLLIPAVQEAYIGLVSLESEPQSAGEVIDLLRPLIAVGFIWLLLQVLATVVVYIAAGRGVALTANGGTPSGLELFRFGMERLATGLAAAFVLFIGFVVISAVTALVGWVVIVSFGTEFFSVFLTTVVVLTALVAVFWLTVGVSLYPQVIAMENVGPSQALFRSFGLVQSRWWPTLGFLMVAGLIVSAVSQVLSIVLVPVLLFGFVVPVFLALGYGLATILQGPVTAAIALAYAVWYVDLRARQAPLTAEQLVQ